MAQHWLFKTEPGTYSLSDLKKEGTTLWNGIRNFQARNFLKLCQKGDDVLIYHSGKDKAVMGLARIADTAIADGSEKEGWLQIKISYEKTFSQPITLAEIKKHPGLSHLLLLKQGRLSISSVNEKEFQILSKWDGKK